MKEITDILKAYQKSEMAGLRSALATVVKVEGSSYRRPGARMLITEDGILTGAISGGCLEGDALRKALSAIIQQEKKLVTYDTTDEDDAKFGVQLGCNGIVHILFEPIKSAEENNPIFLLQTLEQKREDAVIATLFSIGGKSQPGTALFYRPDILLSTLSDEIINNLKGEVVEAYADKKTKFLSYNEDNLEVFVEFIKPPISLIIAGAGNDAQPLADIAALLGWEITIVDGRPAHASAQRFPNANRILVTRPEGVLPQIAIDEQTAFVLMTHNYNYDLALLQELLLTEATYIGTLGPKKKLLRMLEELGLANERNLGRIYGPIGLDIGAETAAEIAISITAEIKSVLSGAKPNFLKDKTLPIHVYNNTPRL